MTADDKLDEHQLRQRTENALWLMSHDGGRLGLEDAARRMGLTRNTLEKHLDRHCKGWAEPLGVVRKPGPRERLHA